MFNMRMCECVKSRLEIYGRSLKNEINDFIEKNTHEIRKTFRHSFGEPFVSLIQI